MLISQRILWIGSTHPDLREHELFSALGDYSIDLAASVAAAMQAIESNAVDLVFVNFPVDEWTPAEVLEQIQRINGSIPVIMRDSCGTCSDAVRLARLGVSQFFGNEFDVEEVIRCIESAMEERRCAAPPTGGPNAVEPWRRLLVGETRGIQNVTQTIRLVARRRCTVLISGETGTGKEMVARAIHMASDRMAQQFVAVNCSAIPQTLLEAELFGYVRGAFTGAQQNRAGFFEQAHNGTLFLDEIGDMPLDLQAKLLRVLQEREFQRLGSAETVRVDVRVLAASNLDLQQAVQQGTFREDLYYRLNVVNLAVPPLRARLADVPVLASHFIEKVCRSESIPLKKISRETVDRLRQYGWPGNVRQLENAVESAVILSGERDTLFPGDFSLPAMRERLSAASAAPPVVPDHGLDFEQTIHHFERSILSQTLRKTGGNKRQAAEMLGLKRTTLSAKVRLLEAQAGCSIM